MFPKLPLEMCNYWKFILEMRNVLEIGCKKLSWQTVRLRLVGKLWIDFIDGIDKFVRSLDCKNLTPFLTTDNDCWTTAVSLLFLGRLPL